MPLSYDDAPTPRVLPVRALLATLLASLGASYWLVPDQKEMVERLMLDQQYGRIAEVLRSLGQDDASLSLHEISVEQLNQITGLIRLTPREQLNSIFSNSRSFTYNRYLHTLVLAAVRYVDVMPPDRAWEIISPCFERLPAEQAADVALLLSRNAMSLSQPSLAAAILDRSTRLPSANADTAKKMALAYRWSSRPAIGAENLLRWLRAHPQAVEFTELAELCSTLALEGGKPDLALDICLESLQRLGDQGVPSRQQLEHALDCALQSTRTVQLIPWLRRYVAAQPESGMSLNALADQATAKSERLAEYRKWATLLARYADWNSQFDTAFDFHLRLAAAGEVESLKRCLDIWDYLGRAEEMATLLDVIDPALAPANLAVRHATILAGLGRDADAKPLYEQWLKQHPDDREVAFDHACLLQDMGDEEAALTAFESLLKHHPNDVPAIKKLAEQYIRAERYAEALKLYSGLRPDDHDHYTLENFAMLAESLDNHELLVTAQLLTAQHLPTIESYLNLADSAGYLEEQTLALRELEHGLQLHPNSAALRVAIGSLLFQNGAFDRAFATLAHSSTRESYKAIVLLLAHASDLVQLKELLEFLGEDVEQRFSLPVQARLNLAVLCHACGEIERGEKLFAAVPATPAHLAMLAEARYNMGALEEAAVLLSRHLNDNPRAKADEWVLLGDLYELLGRDDDAKRAYNYSLNLLTADLPETAAVHPAP